MGGKTIIMLFSKDKNQEPPAIIQDNTCGEYYSFYFFDWRHAVHYVLWCRFNKKIEHYSSYEEWRSIYYTEDENDDYPRFNGDLNEFKNEELGIVWNTNELTYKTGTDLYFLSAWN